MEEGLCLGGIIFSEDGKFIIFYLLFNLLYDELFYLYIGMF